MAMPLAVKKPGQQPHVRHAQEEIEEHQHGEDDAGAVSISGDRVQVAKLLELQS